VYVNMKHSRRLSRYSQSTSFRCKTKHPAAFIKL